MHKRLGKIVFPLFFIITLIDHSLQLYAFVKKDCMFVASSFSSSEAWLYFFDKKCTFYYCYIILLFLPFYMFKLPEVCIIGDNPECTHDVNVLTSRLTLHSSVNSSVIP